MRSLIIALAIIASPVVAMANCTYQTYVIDGKYVRCSTCCYGGHCTTRCF